MRTKLVLESTEAMAMLLAAKNYAAANDWSVSIAVVDETGQLLAFVRMDGATPLSVDMAIAKARTSAAGRRPTQAYESMVNEGRNSLITAPGLTCVEGGVPLQHEGQWLGAIGVSGVTSAQDASIAVVGVEALEQVLEGAQSTWLNHESVS